MNKLKYFIAIALFLSAFNLFSQKIKVKKLVLENGLTVYLSEDHTKPEVFGAVITKAGGRDDPKGATGMAHYQEHMLFKGTQELGTTDWEKEKPHIDKIFKLYDELGKTTDKKARQEIQKKINKESLEAAKYAIPNELSNIIKSMGGTNLNAGTGPDNTVFYNAFPPNQIYRWIDLYAHRFQEPVFRSFQAELEVVYEEKNMYSDMFFSPLLEEFNRNFFKKHPYGQQTLIGTVDDLKNPSLTKMYKFFKKHYVANNMAVIIVGDFKIDEVIPEIKEKFGKWRSGKLPRRIEYKEEDFKGREFVKVKMSPIRLGVLGYRTPPAGSDDEIKLEICNRILSNESQTGLLDKLVMDNKIMAAQVFSMPYRDYGATIFLFIPKIIGQKLEEGENLVLNEIAKVKKGDFDDDMIKAIKNELYVERQLSLESCEDKALLLLDMFAQGKDPEYINKFTDIIKRVTKEDVVKVANKYYGDNYLAFYSKMGIAKKDKIEKPDFEPLKVNTNAKSIYAKHIEKIKTKEPKKDYICFKTVSKFPQNGGIVYFTKNKINDIFNLEIKYGIGEYKIPMLKYATNSMNYAGTEKMSVNELKKQFSLLGCNYDFYSDDSYVYANLEGIDANYDKAVELFMDLINNPKLEQEKIKNLIEETKTERKMEMSDADNVASALFSYVRFKQKSSFLDRLPMKKITELQATDLIKVFKEATTKYYTEVHIIARDKDKKTSKKAISVFNLNTDRQKTLSPIIKESEKYTENTVFYVNNKKARQSKIYFFANGKPFDIKDKPYIDAFNMYFGGGFSGLVLQEVREYRSLAYSAGARFTIPKMAKHNTNFIGYIGTQADKTLEAMEIFYSLVRNMPNKKERLPMIKDYLVQSEITRKPYFRDLSSKIKEWQYMGYTEDPAKYNIPKYKKLSFDDITTFYKENLKDKPIVTVIVTNKKQIKPKDLKKYGKVIVIKEKDLFTK